MINLTDYLFKYHTVKHLTPYDMVKEHILKDKDEIQYFIQDIYFNIQRKDGSYDMLFYDFDNKENPDEAIKEAYRFKDKLMDEFGISAYMQLSGNKGAHIIIFLKEPIQMDYYKEYAEGLIKQFNYHYVDYAVFNKGLRLCRFPDTVNSKSGRKCEPVTKEWESTELIAPAYQKYEKKYRNHLKIKEAIMRRDNHKKNNRRAPLNADNIISHYGIHVISDAGDKIRVLCPLHDDKHSSAVFYKNGGFFCSVCGGYSLYQLISKIEGISPSDKRRMAKKIKEVI